MHKDVYMPRMVKDEVVVPHELYTALGVNPASRCTAYRELFRTNLGEGP